jgi:hypothetical protein
MKSNDLLSISMMGVLCMTVQASQNNVYAPAYFEGDYIHCQASRRTICAGLKLALDTSDTQYADLSPDDIMLVAYKYDPNGRIKLKEKGSCLLSALPADGIKFDRPSYKSSIYYRIYCFPIDRETGKKMEMPIPARSILRLTPITEKLCILLKLPWFPLNMREILTTGEAVGIGLGVAAVGAGLAGAAAWKYRKNQEERKRLTEQEDSESAAYRKQEDEWRKYPWMRPGIAPIVNDIHMWTQELDTRVTNSLIAKQQIEARVDSLSPEALRQTIKDFDSWAIGEGENLEKPTTTKGMVEVVWQALARKRDQLVRAGTIEPIETEIEKQNKDIAYYHKL